MRAVIQRVLEASVVAGGEVVGEIDRGLLIYLGVALDDRDEDAALLAEKTATLRIFEDANEKMNMDAAQSGGGVLVVSAFTVQADARKGRRPSFDSAAKGDEARRLYGLFCEKLASAGLTVSRGMFGAYMKVNSVNDGPVCILLDSKRVF